jgi:hypothetical protein
MWKILNVLFNGEKNMNLCFLQLDSFPIILGIVGSQIEIERIFFWWEYLLILGDVICNQII